MAELIINGFDAYVKWGVRMGQGFIEAIETPCQMKDFIENSSRLEDGKRVIYANPRIAEREVTLQFTIKGSTKEDYKNKKESFINELYKVRFDVKIPSCSDNVYHLLYTGRNVTYGHSKSGLFGKISVKFSEPNPKNR